MSSVQKTELSNLRLPLRWHYLIPALLSICYAALDAQAAELGNIQVHSWLGRQLKASVPLIGVDARESEVRCFKGALVNLNREPVSTLKVALQHSSKGSVLLLTGGNVVDEPAAMVLVENICGTGASREYAVLLDLVPDAPAVTSTPTVIPLAEKEKDEAIAPQAPAIEKSAAPVRAENPLEYAETARRGTQAAQKLQKTPANTEIVSAMTGMLKMAAMLADPYADRILHAAHSSPGNARAGISREPMQPDISPQPLLKLDRSLAKPDRAGQSPGEEKSIGLKASIIGALSFFFILGAAIWIFLRIREMRATARPWVPSDMVLDSSSEDPKPVSPLVS